MFYLSMQMRYFFGVQSSANQAFELSFCAGCSQCRRKDAARSAYKCFGVRVLSDSTESLLATRAGSGQ